MDELLYRCLARLALDAQVMWLIDTSNPVRLAEIGWRRTCTVTGPRDALYYAIGPFGVSPSEFRDGSNNPVFASPGERWRVSIGQVSSASSDNATWNFQIQGPSGTYEASVSGQPTAFQPNRIDVGGENLYDLNDMGVSGHLDPIIRYSNGSYTIMTLDPNVTYVRTNVERYDITHDLMMVGAGEGFFQTFSNIHANETPTTVPEGTPNCATE